MTRELKKFMNAWGSFEPGAAGDNDQVLGVDRELIGGLGEGLVARHRTWQQVINDPRFGGAPKDERLQLGLVPQPFMGDIERAKVIILLLNPGLAPSDFHAEFKHPEFRVALLKNLRGELRGTTYPFLFLDPQWAWTGGYSWWFKLLRKVIYQLMTPGATMAGTQAYVAQNLAAIELIPYHSRDSPGNQPRLPSSELAIALARSLHRTGRKLVVARRHKCWGFDQKDEGVFICKHPRGVNLPLRKPEDREDGAGDFVLKALSE